jgi:uncharacterized membrane protein YjgN (DUF898 family)
MERTPPTAIPFRFSGSAGEYFRIWIVNLALSLLTLGIYSAWAKVRRLKYFYSHTRLGQSGFDYLADPVAVLKGRVIAVVVVVIYSLLSHFSPVAGAVMGVMIGGAVPVLVVRTLRFRTRNTAYRGLRFDFKGSVSGAVGPYLGYFLLIPFTLGIIYPFIVARQRLFQFNGFRYGQSAFTLDLSTGSVYVIFLKALGLLLPPLAAAFGVMAGLRQQGLQPPPTMGVGLSLLYLLALLLTSSYLQSALTNCVWNNLSLGPHRFHSTLRFLPLLWINFSNAVAIMLSLGLMFPWTRVRTVRYRVENLTLLVQGDLNEFLAAETSAVRATGEELADFLDVDIAL